MSCEKYTTPRVISVLLISTCFKKATKIDNCRRGVRRHAVRTSMQ